MLHLIERLLPKGVHRRVLRLAHRLRLIWWRIARPQLIGCRVLAFDAEGRLLLIRHSYGSGRWMLPGGGLGKGEDPLLGALRELREETGCTLDDAHEFMVVEEPLSGTSNRVHLITGTARGNLKPDGREVIVAEFFATDALPSGLAVALARGLPDWLRAAKAGRPLPPAAA